MAVAAKLDKHIIKATIKFNAEQDEAGKDFKIANEADNKTIQFTFKVNKPSDPIIGGGGFLPPPIIDEGKDDKKPEEVKPDEPTESKISDEVIAQVKEIRLVARSKKVKKGIRITWNQLDYLDGYEVWKSATRNKGYNKMWDTKNRKYLNTKGLKKGKRYFYKVRGYKVLADGTRVYTRWSLKAFRIA